MHHTFRTRETIFYITFIPTIHPTHYSEKKYSISRAVRYPSTRFIITLYNSRNSSPYDAPHPSLDFTSTRPIALACLISIIGISSTASEYLSAYNSCFLEDVSLASASDNNFTSCSTYLGI